MFVITGASGHVGSIAAEALLAAGKKVRVVVRDVAKAARLKAPLASVELPGVCCDVSLPHAVN